MRVKRVEIMFWNIRLFLSFQITQTVVNQIILKNKCEKNGMPAILVNRVKWRWSSPAGTEDIPNQLKTLDHRSPKKLQCRKRCVVDSVEAHPSTHVVSFECRMPRCAKLSLVGSLLRNRRHAKRDTLEGTCLCQTSSTWFLSTKSPVLVMKR